MEMIKFDNNIIDDSNDYFVPRTTKKKTKMKPISDNIYTLDIEVTSLFSIYGEYKPFNYELPIEYYRDTNKVAVPYIWMFGINDTTYYGREFMELEQVFKSISDSKVAKVIYIFNLSYEFQFLLNIFQNYTIENMICRTIRKPIQFYVKELNLYFRCAYMLTNMNLENASKEYTNVTKKVGDLDYNINYSPLSKLDNKSLGYCEYDIICLREIIKYFKAKYDNHIWNIPLTNTSIVRKQLKKEVDYFYFKNQWKLVPNAKMYLIFMQCFSGGYTHANALHVGRIFDESDGLIKSKDISSSYPASMVLQGYPSSHFTKCNGDSYFNERGKYCHILHVRLYNVKSRFYNHYLQYSKLFYSMKSHNAMNVVVDNGRVSSIKMCELFLTDIDLDLILKNYKADLIILNCWRSRKRYLDLRLIKFLLKLYGGKTKLKGVIGETDEETEHIQELYRTMKSQLNSIYGCSVSNQLNYSSDWDSKNNEWIKADASDIDYINEKLSDMKKSYSTIFQYCVGVFITAYSRKAIADIILTKEMDRDVIYFDTDSIKYRNNHEHVFEEYNKMIEQKYHELIDFFDGEITLEDLKPKDKNGIEHPIGYFEDDGCYTEFVTLGAKKYCYRDMDGELHLTVSGINKKGVSALKNDIHNFNVNMTWGYKESGKLTHYYNDEQTQFDYIDNEGNSCHCNLKYSIVLQPTTYNMSVTEKYELYLKMIEEKEMIEKWQIKKSTMLKNQK